MRLSASFFVQGDQNNETSFKHKIEDPCGLKSRYYWHSYNNSHYFQIPVQAD